MCGRYLITTVPEAMRALFRYFEQPNFPSRYNVAPTQPVPIVRMIDGQKHFALVRWGLIPPWAKDPGPFTLLINARGETINEKPAFRNELRRRRCLFPADGFYEWKTVSARKRSCVARLKAGGPMAFAGLWETWTGPNGEELETAAIITTESNTEMAAVHHRAPVIVPPEQFDFWLDCANINEQEAASLFVRAPEGSMEVYEISTAVNRVANDSPELLKPYDASAEAPPPQADKPKAARKPVPKPQAEDTGQGSLF
jgi:putative SOS response-associated peptidase YedK